MSQATSWDALLLFKVGNVPNVEPWVQKGLGKKLKEGIHVQEI